MASPAEGHPTTLLVIDDQPFFTTMLRNVLEQQGFRVLTASGGREGLAIARKQPPDGILLDVEMPEMNGFDVCQAIRQDETLRQIPVVILTATNDTKLNEKAFAAGADITALKSLSGERLVNLIRLALSRGKPSHA
jgi:CheY-like chemotaxis protein